MIPCGVFHELKKGGGPIHTEYPTIALVFKYLMEASSMEKPDDLDFKVGQLAEMRTFETGYRGAWFRCKICDILLKKNKILLEYYDFEEEELSWEKIYQVPPYARKSKHIKRQLMVRPQYPVMYHKSEMPTVISISSQVCVVIDGTWKVGDLVDWFKDGCYWSARIVKVLSDDKVQVELPMPPAGEGKEEEEERNHEAFCKDLRPFLDWSQTQGWTLPTLEGQTSCDAQLIFLSKQGMDLEAEHAAAGSPVNAAPGSPVNASSTNRLSAEGDTVICEKNQNVKMDDDLVESSDSISSLRVEKRKASDEIEGDNNNNSDNNNNNNNNNSSSSNSISSSMIDLNIMHEDTLEAAILDLEELANKVRWIKRILEAGQSPSNDATASWKFV